MGSKSSFRSDVRSFGQSRYFQYHEKGSVIFFLIVEKKHFLILKLVSFSIQKEKLTRIWSLDLSCSDLAGESEDFAQDLSFCWFHSVV